MTTPTEFILHKQSKTLEISFDNGSRYHLPFEYLRVFSPSAEVRGHGHGQEVLQTGKKNVSIDEVEMVGQYAIQPTFSDGHNTGIYSWSYLYALCTEQEKNWQDYLAKLEAAGKGRE